MQHFRRKTHVLTDVSLLEYRLQEYTVARCAGHDSLKEIKKLMTIPGIGSWTAQYIAMRAMEWPDAFLETDTGVKKALQPYTSKELLKMAEAWRPWRSYATVNLWNTL